VVAILLLSLVQSCKCWSGAQEGESGLYKPDLFLLWPSAEDAAVRPDLSLSVLWNGKGSGPQRLPEYFETRAGVSGLAPKSPHDNRFSGLVAGAVTLIIALFNMTENSSSNVIRANKKEKQKKPNRMRFYPLSFEKLQRLIGNIF
jgi:hypothetical protein